MQTSTSTFVIDVDEASFQTEVLDRSRQVPVVVDFWAPWCGPCRMLSPTLEALAEENAGRFILAKINVDENQGLAMQFGVQGIPAVKAFRDGRPAAEFVGAQPQPMVRQFIDRLLPSEADQKVDQAKALLNSGNVDAAEALLRAVLAGDSAHAGAWLNLAHALLSRGQDQDALDALGHVPLGTPEGNEAARLRRESELRAQAGSADESALRGRLAEEPADLDARYTLASLLTLQHNYQEALDQYLEIMRRNRSFRNGAARQAMLHVFEVLGEDPLVRTYRNRLASVLFA